jgi:hypothetical protein
MADCATCFGQNISKTKQGTKELIFIAIKIFKILWGKANLFHLNTSPPSMVKSQLVPRMEGGGGGGGGGEVSPDIVSYLARCGAYSSQEEDLCQPQRECQISVQVSLFCVQADEKHITGDSQSFSDQW